MKTRAELEAIAERIHDMMDYPDFSDNPDCITYKSQVIQLLEDLHSEGMMDACKIADDYDGKTLDGIGYYDQLGDAKATQSAIYKAILSAIENKPKI